MPSLPKIGNLNLDESEKKVYMVLLQFGKSTIEKISFLGGLSLDETNEAINRVIKKNLVIENKDYTFSLNSKKIPEYLAKLQKFDTPSNVTPKFLVVNGFADVNNYWKSIEDKTKNELLIFSGDLSWIDRRFEEIKNMIKRGIKCKIIFFKFNKKILHNVKKAVEAGAEVGFFDDPTDTLRCIISDEEKLFITEKIPKLGFIEKLDEGFSWDKSNFYIGTFITGGILPRSFRHYFFSLWKNSIPFNNYFKEHDIS